MSTRVRILYIVSLAAFLRSFAQVIYVPSLPTMRAELGTTTSMLGLTLSVYGFVLALSQIAYGPIIDRTNAKTVLLAGLSLFILGSAGGYLTRGIELLIASRALQALGIAAAAGVGVALISDVFPDSERGRAMSTFSMANSIGAASGPALGGFLALVFSSWRVDFAGLALVGMLLMLATLWQLPPQPVHGQRVGLADMLHIARTPATFGALWLGMTQFYGVYTIHVLTPSLLTERLAANEVTIGLVATTVAISATVGQWFGGRAADARGLRHALVVGGLGSSLAYALLTFVSAILQAPMSPLLVAGAIAGVGFAAGYGFPSQLNIMVVYFSEMRGTAGALQFFARFVGTTIGPVLVGFLADEVSLSAGYGSAAILITVGALIAFFTISNPAPAQAGAAAS